MREVALVMRILKIDVMCSLYPYSLEVLVTLTSDVGKVLTSLHKVQPKGDVHFLTGVKKAHVR
jgi:hypothetical protein